MSSQAPFVLSFLGGLAFVWGVCWWIRRLVLQWMGMLGRPATPPGGWGAREAAARRSLRALLAFDAFVVVPVGLIPVVILLLPGGGAWSVAPIAAVMLLSILAFSVPLLSLARTIREMEQRRARDEVAETVSFWIDGPAVALRVARETGDRALRLAMVTMGLAGFCFLAALVRESAVPYAVGAGLWVAGTVLHEFRRPSARARPSA